MRQCGDKQCYGKLQAERVAKHVMKVRNRRIRVYECHCGYYHLTSQMTKEAKYK